MRISICSATGKTFVLPGNAINFRRRNMFHFSIVETGANQGRRRKNQKKEFMNGSALPFRARNTGGILCRIAAN
ncbi:hypothetical protein [Variovorax sp. UC74_104]|uniref:hypothetical protein n=1 Tax=Variovorax sp. UC74_104 TaxID=3374555 RepID=UPI0037567714